MFTFIHKNVRDFVQLKTKIASDIKYCFFLIILPNYNITFMKTPRYNWNIVESGVKHHYPPPIYGEYLVLILINYLIANDNDQQVLIIVVKSQTTPISQESYVSISATLKEK